jgi:predicted PurR-regulated permease PerM
MSISRPTAFWIGVLVTAIAAVALLREVLLPFVAGMVLATYSIRLLPGSNGWE